MSEGPQARVLVAHADSLTEMGLTSLLGLQDWVGYCLCGRTRSESVELAEKYQPHVALVDMMLEYPLGREIAAQVIAVSPETKILVITSGSDRLSSRANEALHASGHIGRSWSSRRLADTIRMAVEGAANGIDLDVAEELSRREREVLDLIAAGATNAEIAEQLFLSPHTVKEHTSHIYRKLKARNRVEAVQRAQRAGLIHEALAAGDETSARAPT